MAAQPVNARSENKSDHGRRIPVDIIWSAPPPSTHLCSPHCHGRRKGLTDMSMPIATTIIEEVGDVNLAALAYANAGMTSRANVCMERSTRACSRSPNQNEQLKCVMPTASWMRLIWRTQVSGVPMTR